jgi:hypothetical protein
LQKKTKYSYKMPNPANAFPHNLTWKPVLAIGDFGKETWLNETFLCFDVIITFKESTKTMQIKQLYRKTSTFKSSKLLK